MIVEQAADSETGIQTEVSDELDQLPSDVEEELTLKGGTTRLICVWGRRPIAL